MTSSLPDDVENNDQQHDYTKKTEESQDVNVDDDIVELQSNSVDDKEITGGCAQMCRLGVR